MKCTLVELAKLLKESKCDITSYSKRQRRLGALEPMGMGPLLNAQSTTMILSNSSWSCSPWMAVSACSTGQPSLGQQ